MLSCPHKLKFKLFTENLVLDACFKYFSCTNMDTILHPAGPRGVRDHRGSFLTLLARLLKLRRSFRFLIKGLMVFWRFRSALSHSSGMLILAMNFTIPMVLEAGVLRARSFLRPCLPDSSFLDMCFGFFADSVLSLPFCAFLRTFVLGWSFEVVSIVGGFCLLFVSRSVLWRGLPGTVNLFVRARWLSHGRFCGGVCPVPWI